MITTHVAFRPTRTPPVEAALVVTYTVSNSGGLLPVQCQPIDHTLRAAPALCMPTLTTPTAVTHRQPCGVNNSNKLIYLLTYSTRVTVFQMC